MLYKAQFKNTIIILTTCFETYLLLILLYILAAKMMNLKCLVIRQFAIKLLLQMFSFSDVRQVLSNSLSDYIKFL